MSTLFPLLPNPASEPLPFKRKRWLCSGHLETIAALFSPLPPVPFNEEMIQTRDNDELLLSFSHGAADKPLVILLHGLEGCAQTHALRVAATHFKQHGWSVAAPHFRSCGGRINRLPRAYHAADGEEVAWMVDYCQNFFKPPAIFVVGLSLGGCALVHGLAKHSLPVRAAATICAPFELKPCVQALDSGQGGINRHLYVRYFLRSLRKKIIAKSHKYPFICDLKALKRARTFKEFDSLYTAPVHGFKDADDYWQQSSITRLLPQTTTPLLLINTKNDPMIPFATVPNAATNTQANLHFCQTTQGGHAGFIGEPDDWLFRTIYDFFNTAGGLES